MRCGKLSNLVVVPEREGGGKMNAHDYVDAIMDGRCLTSGWRVQRSLDKL